VFELVDRLHQADIAFLNQIDELRLMYFFSIETRRTFACTISLHGFSNDWSRPAFLAKICKKKAGETTILRIHRRHLLELA
jgi:hypothetical protein